MCKYIGLNICHYWHSEDLFCVSLRNKSSVFLNNEVLLTLIESVAYTELEATSFVLFHFFVFASVFSTSIRTSTCAFWLFLVLAMQVASQTG